MRRKTKRQSRQRNLALGLIIGGMALLALVTAWRLASSSSTDSGPRALSRLTASDFHSLAFSPSEPDTIYFGHHYGLMISRDGGRNWEATTLQNADAMALAAPPANSQIMYAAGHNVFFKSTDGGVTWQSVATNLPGLDIHGFAADPQNADFVFAHIVGFGGLFRSQDGGATWTALPAPLPAATFNIAAGETGQTLYAAAGNAGLWRSRDGGESWAQAPGTPGEAIVALAYNPADKRLFISTYGEGAGLYASDDGGDTWKALGLKANAMAVAASPHDPDRLIAVDEKGWVYASRDGGLTWPGN
jgi:photosystem II stability/assembly factor-like uncharacterized protein